MGFCAPLATDDLEFSGYRFQSFSEVLNYSLQYGNGRLLGNLGGVFLASSRFLRTTVRALITAGCIVLFPTICKINNSLSYWLSFIFFTFLYSPTFAQLFTWSAGFQNYIPPIFLLLLAVFLIQKYESMSTAGRIVNLLVLLLIGICSQLYVEHNTCINILLAVCLLLYAIRQKKALILPAWISLIAASVGGGIMFAIPHLFGGESSRSAVYRSSIFSEGIIAFLKKILTNFADVVNDLSSFFFLFIILSVACISILIRNREKISERVKSTLILSFLIPTSYFFFNTYICRNNWYGSGASIRFYLNIPFLAVFFSAFLVTVFLCKREKFPLIASLTALAAASVLPFMAVTKFGSRCMFLGYLILGCAAIILFDDEITEVKMRAPEISHITRTVLAVSCLAIAFCLILTFVNLGHLYDMLWDYFDTSYAAGLRTFDYFESEDPLFCHTFDQYSLYWYYDTPGDIEFHKISLEEWLNLYAQ